MSAQRRSSATPQVAFKLKRTSRVHPAESGLAVATGSAHFLSVFGPSNRSFSKRTSGCEDSGEIRFLIPVIEADLEKTKTQNIEPVATANPDSAG